MDEDIILKNASSKLLRCIEIMTKYNGFISGSFPLYYLAEKLGSPWHGIPTVKMSELKNRSGYFPQDVDIFIPVSMENENEDSIPEYCSNIISDFGIIVDFTVSFSYGNGCFVEDSIVNVWSHIYKLGPAFDAGDYPINIHVYNRYAYVSHEDFVNSFDIDICKIIWTKHGGFSKTSHLTLKAIKEKLFSCSYARLSDSTRENKYIAYGYAKCPHISSLLDLSLYKLNELSITIFGDNTSGKLVGDGRSLNRLNVRENADYFFSALEVMAKLKHYLSVNSIKHAIEDRADDKKIGNLLVLSNGVNNSH